MPLCKSSDITIKSTHIKVNSRLSSEEFFEIGSFLWEQCGFKKNRCYWDTLYLKKLSSLVCINNCIMENISWLNNPIKSSFMQKRCVNMYIQKVLNHLWDVFPHTGGYWKIRYFWVWILTSHMLQGYSAEPLFSISEWCEKLVIFQHEKKRLRLEDSFIPF